MFLSSSSTADNKLLMLDDHVDDGEAVVLPHTLRHDNKPLTIKIPAMARSVTDMANYGPRRSTRNRKSSDSFTQPSGSEYSASGSVASDDKNMEDAEGEDDPGEENEPVQDYTTSRGRPTKVKKSYAESDVDDVEGLFNSDDSVTIVRSKRSRNVKPSRRAKRIVSDDDGEVALAIQTRRSARKLTGVKENGIPPASPHPMDEDDGRQLRKSNRRITRKNARQVQDEDSYDDAKGDVDPPGSSEDELDAAHTTPSPEPDAELDTGLEDTGTRAYSLHRRTKQINYAIPPPLEEMRPAKGPSKSRGKGRARPGWSATGAELARYM